MGVAAQDVLEAGSRRAMTQAVVIASDGQHPLPDIMDSYFLSDRPFIVHIPSNDQESYFPVFMDEEALEFDDDSLPFDNPDYPKLDVRAWPRHFHQPEPYEPYEVRLPAATADLTFDFTLFSS